MSVDVKSKSKHAQARTVSPEPWMTSQTPGNPLSDGSNHGNAFTPQEDLLIHGVRRWRLSGNTGIRQGQIYLRSTPPTLLAEADMNLTGLANNIWVEARFPTPLRVTAGTQYIVAVTTPVTGQNRASADSQSVRSPVATFNGITTAGVLPNFSVPDLTRGQYLVDFLYTIPEEPPPEPITVTIDPPSATVPSQGTKQFYAQVENSTQGVTWHASAGSISNGYFHAPVGPATVTITATSIEDPGVSATAQVTVNAPYVPPPDGGEAHGQNGEIRAINAQIIQLRREFGAKHIQRQEFIEQIHELARELKQAQIRARQ